MPSLIGDMRKTESTTTVAAVILEAVEKGTHAQRVVGAVGGDLVGVCNIDAQSARRWLSGVVSPALPRCGLVRDPADPVFPLRVPLNAKDSVG